MSADFRLLTELCLGAPLGAALLSGCASTGGEPTGN